MDENIKLTIEKSFCGLVDLYGVSRVARMKGMSTNQVKKKYLRERDGVKREKKPHKPKPIR
ncbi:MAG: hypothetical protein H6961_10115 [Chromatiaceae bacterium]|nr:hypothetical protein [Chromatiaceae bacterium]